jgi:dipeptidyl aminopeptidase/acylaminoacyl peptidase
MLVHGGPYSRDSWGFDREVQFLARLGYHVIQVNFRGSTGFNRTYSMNEDKDQLFKICKKAATDFADAARWAIEEGITDPESLKPLRQASLV